MSNDTFIQGTTPMNKVHKVKKGKDLQKRIANTGVGEKTFKETKESTKQPQKFQQTHDMNNTTISAGGFTQIQRESQGNFNVLDVRSDQSVRISSKHSVVDEANIGLNSEKAETEVEFVEKPHFADFDTTNMLSPLQATDAILKKVVYPEHYDDV